MKIQFRPVWRDRILHALMIAIVWWNFVRDVQAAKAKAPIEPPQVTAAVNGTAVVQLCRGWPLILDVCLLHPHSLDPKVKALALASATGKWSDLLQLPVTNDQGQPQAWPFHFGNAPRPSIKLSNKVMGCLFWYLSPEDTAQIATGNYSLEAVLDTTASRSKWQGTERSPDVSIEIIDEPVPLTPELEEAKYTLLARYHVRLGNRPQAMADIELLLAAQPNNIAGLGAKAVLLELDGQLTEALAACNQAIASVYAQTPNPVEPPEQLMIKARDLRNKLSGLP